MRENSLGVEDGVAGVHGSIVLGSLTNQTLLISEGNERRGGERTLLVGDDFDIGTLVGSNAGVGSTCEMASVRILLRSEGFSSVPFSRLLPDVIAGGQVEKMADEGIKTHPNQCQWHRHTLRPPF